MNRIRLAVAMAMSLLLTSCAGEYRYSVFTLDSQQLSHSPTRSGEAKPEICRYLFEPGPYTGPVISIPESATVFGAVVVSRGDACAIIPLFRWTEPQGTERYGCNGPSSHFAREAETQDKLIETIVDVVAAE